MADLTVLNEQRWGRLDAALYDLTTWSPHFFKWARTVKLLHAHMGPTGVHALLASRRLGLPLVTSYYGFDVTLLASSDRFRRPFWHYALRHEALFQQADRILVLSEHMKRALLAQGAREDRLRIVRLGVDLKRFLPRARPSTAGALEVLMVGREVEKKGFDDGLRACALARDGGCELKVRILGLAMPGQVALRALADELGLDVDWLDPTTRTALAMSRADVLLCPSRTASNGDQEGTPTVICEAGASGLAIISTRHAGIPEQIDDGRSGLLSDERDVASMAKHLIDLGRSPELRFELGRAAVEKMQNEYSFEAHRESLQRVYDPLI